MENTAWAGRHVIFDGYFTADAPLRISKHPQLFLLGLAEKLQMHVMTNPSIFEFPLMEGQDFAGITGIVILSTSHVSVHTYPERRFNNGYFVSLDVYSCTPYEVADVVDYLKQCHVFTGRTTIIERFSDMREQVILQTTY